MNEIMQQLDLLKETLALKTQILESLNDDDLALKLGGTTMSLGELCKEMGETEQIYIDSFKSLKMNWRYQYPDTAVLSNVTALKAWHSVLDAELFKVLESIPDEDVTGKFVERGGFNPPLGVQFHIFREGLLIFAGKASIYLRVLNKDFSEQLRTWIA